LIQFNPNTASLAQGTYTADVTVFAPGAVASPQSVLVVAQVGVSNYAGGTPLDSYVTPGSTCDVEFSPLCSFPGGNPPVSTQDGGMWLSLVVQNLYLGTLGPICESTWVHLAPPASMAPGTYYGIIGQTTPVTMHLVAQPLAVPTPSVINLVLALGGPAMAFPFIPAISLNPAGTVTASSATASGAGIGASVSEGLAFVSVDPTSLTPPGYSGSVTIGCNAADCPVIVPVGLIIFPQGPPVPESVADNVTFAAGSVAPGDVAVVEGWQLSVQTPAYAHGAPLPTSLGGASVLVNGVAAPLYYSSSNQIAFELPGSTPIGSFPQVQVQRDGQTSSYGPSLTVAQHAPEIAAVTGTDYNLRDAYHPAHAGDTLIVWAIGLGATNPAVPDGTAAPSSPPVVTTVTPTVQFGSSITATPSFSGLSPGAVGLYQVNVTIPPNVAGNIFLKLVFPDATSNAVPIAIE
jgi:uncharacterized protein (TIGR03437 family)